MRAVVFDQFGAAPEIREVPDPVPAPDGAIVRVEVTGLCRSDWHGWRGHDPDIRLPHVPGHEFAGVLVAVGGQVTGWTVGDRVTAPFVCACGRCAACLAGDHQVCHHQTQPGFTYWGSFAEYVAVDRAEVNLVRLPADLDFAAAAALGCRFATSFRAVVTQGRVTAGEWVAVYGCGGVGLSAVMIAAACGARVVAVDVSPAALGLARRCGAAICLDASDLAEDALVAAVRDATGGGAHLSMDALGSHATCVASIRSLRRRGRHVQIGLLPRADGHPRIPMDEVIAGELALLGSHGMAAHAYPPMLEMISAGTLRPGLLITGTMGLPEVPRALATMGEHTGAASVGGIRLIRPAAS
ncbi:MAG TPA: zinc-dependent alcohol dehydrogenase family protein [Micromonosporaceae bacterium]|nr:zinc-dependent alcohol dehydrogenase family protein [Micromonosporaceae bacterium]